MKYVILHVVARGVRRGSLFESERDLRRFMALVKRFARALGVRIIAYCLMGNHYHLLVVCPETEVSTFLHRLNRTYAEAFNKATERSGHVFDRRGRAFDRSGALVVPCVAVYILLNPVMAGRATHPCDYGASSYAYNVGDRPLPDWMDDTELTRCFSADPGEGRRIFKEFLNSFVEDIPTLREGVAHWYRSNGKNHRTDRQAYAVEFATLTALAVSRAPNLRELESSFGVDEIDVVILAITEIMQVSNEVLVSALWAAYRVQYTRQGIARRRRRLLAKFAAEPGLHQAMVKLAKGAMLFIPRPKVSTGTR